MTGPRKNQDKRNSSASDRDSAENRQDRDSRDDLETRRSRADIEGDEDIADEGSFSPDDLEEEDR